MSGVDAYRGNRIVIRNNGSRCIHSRYCVLGRPDVFVPNVDGPWIQPDAAAADTVAAQIALCLREIRGQLDSSGKCTVDLSSSTPTHLGTS